MDKDGFRIGGKNDFLLPKIREDDLLDITNQNIVVIINCLFLCHLSPSFHFSKICVHYIQRLHLHFITLNYAEYELLTSSGSIKKLMFFNTSITKSDNTVLPVESILEMVPNALTFEK